ncbi:DUF4347 domain-containing protein [Azospirillum brasilense]|uniref:DUF4347 domain-containing protein n=1 Tax=Azospirillum brasilense TaxID=192 RepID=UPI001EDB8021|nr:DUF4347 domain-containing protein [Azospirillum brasilense]UKJ77352.1 DUF4347 domain-containing protein [Azospirillum brasilense]
MALEPRFMFDAAGAVTVAEVHHQPDQPAPGDKGASKATDTDKLVDWVIKESTVPAASSSPAASTPSPTEPAAVTARLAGLQGVARSVVFVDTSVSDYQTLLKDIAPDAKVVLLDSQQEALGQMAKALSGMSGLDSVQIVSHGNEGHLYIAGRAYWADGLANRAQDLQAIGTALKPGGDILFYACNVGAGQAGQEFVQTIHRLTGADVAVSSDETGNAAGQNWTLEVRSGAIEAAIPFARASMETFSGRLGTVVVTSATGTAAGSLNDAIKNATQATIIEFSPTLASGTVSLGVTTALLSAAAQDLTINGDVNGDGIADITISGDGDASNTTTTADYRGIAFNAASKTLTIKNLIFERFYTLSAAQGVLTLQNGSLEVDGVTFRNNLSNVIATLNTATSLTIKNSVFRENTSAVAGTAAFSVIKSQVAGTFTVENSVFVDNNYVMNAGSNSSDYPGGIIMHQSIVSAFTTNIRNVTIANNSYINNDAAAAGIKTAAIGLFFDPKVTGTSTANVYNTIIAGNTGKLGTTNFSDPNAIIYNSAKITLNAGNNYQNAITGTATFVDSSNATVSLRDYRPASSATTFINTGDSSNANRYGGSYDIRGIDRIRDGALDLGAYEVHWNAGAPTVDLNGAGGGSDESVSSGTPSSGVLIAPSATVAQTDSDTRLLGATVALSGVVDTGNETLTLSTADISTAKMYGIAVLANDGATITLSGAASVANYQAVIRLIQYKNTAGSFTAGARTATVTVNDGETTSTARTSTITLGTVVDTTPPTVSSIAVSGTPAANASSVSYTVTFSEGVSGVDAADFTLATTGTASGTIGTVTQVSASVYTVSITGISGAGTLGLNLKGTGTGIKDTANNDIAAGFTGSTHTVDQVAPTFDVAAATSSITNTGFTLSASLNEAGTIYYVLVPRNATAPTAAEVEAGTASGGGTALKSGSLSASSSPFDGSGSITGLTAGTNYDLYVVAKDSAGNLMSAPVKINVSTTGGSSNGAPVNSTVPTVSGTATVGNALTGAIGTWSDPDGDPLGYTYQWYRADDSNGTNAASISGATSSSYTLTTSDAHKYLRVAVIANDGNSNTTTAYSAYTAILNSAPVNSAVPNVTGTATVGNALSTTNGTWSDADGDGRSFSYQWYRADDSNGTNAASISGATSSNYTLTTSDAHKYLRVVVTANDGKGGTQTATSAYTAILNSAPVNSAVPNVTGTATVGNALSTTNGTWSDADGDGRSFSYQWYRADDSNGTNAASISGATSSSYTLAAGDLNKYLRVVVTANDGKGGTQAATSAYSSQVAAAGNGAPVNSTVPTVSGTATVGNALTGAIGTWSDPDGDPLGYTYQWYRADDSNGTNAASISGATSSSYTLTTSDAHKYLRVAVIANDGNSNTTTAYSAYTAILNSAPVNSAVPNVTGTATVGNALSTTNGTWSDADGDGRSFSYQWYRADDSNGTNAASISGATSSSYTLAAGDLNKYLRVVVTANDGKGGTQAATSAYSSQVAAAGNGAPVNSTVPTVSGTATVGNALTGAIGTWSDPDGDPLGYTYQWYRADDSNGTNAASISGATSSSYTLTTSDAHKYLRVAVIANDGNSNTTTAYSAYTAILNSAPVNSAVPNVTGTATVGNALSTTNGTWSDADGDGRSFSYQWYRADDSNGTNAASISGATSSNYTLTTSDAHKYLRVVVTANDGKGGTQTATSAYTAILNSAPVNSAVPNVTGTATVGNALSTTNGTWSDADGDGRSFSYQWYRADDSNGTNAASISGATSSSYTLAAGDLNKYLRVVVTANDGKGGTQAATSAYSSQVAAAGNGAPVNSTVPTVSGTATVGNALTGAIGTWSDPDGDPLGYTYQWYRADDSNGTNAASISGATSSSYTLTTSDAHKYLRVAVIANDGNSNTTTAYSAYTAILNSAPVNSAVPNVTGTATVGNALSTTNGTWSDADGDGRSFSYQWYRADDSNGTNAASISGATSSSYTLTTSDAHKYLRVVVTANDGKGGTQTATSAYTAITNSAPVLSTDARSLTAIDEDATSNNGDTVAAILASAGTATDVDGNALGIAITAIDSSNGTWQYKTGAGTWTTISGVSSGSALLLAGTDRVRFVPNADYNGSVVNGITFKAWDQTSGTAGTTVGNDTTANGGLGAGGQFSAASATADIAVTAVNDAPVLTDTVLTLPSVAQAAGAPNGAVGVAVSSLVALGGNVSDVDSGAVTGIALVGIDVSEGGTWYYSTDGGTSWTAVGTVNDSGSALLLRTTDRLYYRPTGANAGVLSAAITFRAWDQTSGTAGAKVATAGGGGISAFSAATDTASLSITPAALGSAVTLAPASDTGNSNTDNITKASSVTFNGSGANANANANTTVRLYANGSLVATTTADASGAYSFAGVDVSGLSGAVDFTVRQVIAGMESADSAIRTVTFDRTAPTVAITTVTGDNVLNAAESAVAQTVAGTTTGVEDGQTVTVTLNGKTYSATVTNNAWSLSIPPADLQGLTDGGHYAITADLTDVAGNAAVQATRGVSVDRTPPTLAIATVAGDNVLNAADSAVGQTVSGVTNGVEDGQTITVTLNGKTYSTTVTNNRWGLTVPSTDLLALTDGTSYTVTASLTDAAGNPTQATRNVSVDRTPPSVVSVTPPPARTYLPGETVSFFVQLSEASIINGGNPVLELAVGSEIRNAVYNAAGSTGTLLRFDYVVPVGDRAPQGIAVLGLALNGSIVTDAAQGPLVTTLKGVGDTSQVRIDTPIPAKPVGTALSGLSDSGVSATDRLTNVTRPTLSGTAEANATVTVLVDGKAVGTTVADENGFWVHRLQTALTDGTHSITTTATNRFGIVSDPSDALAVVIDTAVPVAPAPLVTSATVAGATGGERISGIATPSLAGTTEAGSTVNVLVDGKVAGTAVADANGAWTFQFTAALADGTHSVQVQATDRAGNVSSLSAVTTLTIDTTPPLAPTVTLNTTAGNTPVVQGTAEANSLVTVTVNGQAVGTARASASGAWQLALASDLSVGSYVIAAKASDAVGNTGNAGTTTYSVAPPPPPPAVVAAASTGNTTTAASSSNSAVATAAGTGTAQTTGPTLGTAPTLPGLQTSSDAGRVITSSSIGNGSGAGNGNSSTDAGRSITIGNIGNSTSSDAGRSITISAMGGAPSGGGTASSSSGVLGGGTGGSSGSGLSGVVSGGSGLGSGGLGGGGLGGGVGGGSGLGGSASGGIGAGLGATGAGAGIGGGPGVGLGAGGPAMGGPATGGPATGGPATGAGAGNGGLNGGVGGPVGAPGTASGGTPGGSTAPGGAGTAAGGLGGAPGNRPGGATGPGSTIENAPTNRPAGQGGAQGRPQGQGQPPAGDAPAGGDPSNAPAAPDGSGQAPGPRADLDGSSPARPAFSRQVAQIHGAADAQTAALLAALTSHVPPGSRAA